MLVKKQKLLHCPKCQGEVGRQPKGKYTYVTHKCPHCEASLVTYWKEGVKLSKY